MWPRAVGWVGGEWPLSSPACTLGAAFARRSTCLGCPSPPNCCLPSPQLLEGNFALFCTYTLGFRNEFQNILLAIMVCMALSWSPSGVRLVGCVLGDPQLLPRSWHGMGAPWTEGREAVGL